jgi:hypothetical protein
MKEGFLFNGVDVHRAGKAVNDRPQHAVNIDANAAIAPLARLDDTKSWA